MANRAKPLDTLTQTVAQLQAAARQQVLDELGRGIVAALRKMGFRPDAGKPRVKRKAPQSEAETKEEGPAAGAKIKVATTKARNCCFAETLIPRYNKRRFHRRYIEPDISWIAVRSTDGPPWRRSGARGSKAQDQASPALVPGLLIRSHLADFGFGSGPTKLTASITSPLSPQQRTLRRCFGTSA